ncbi:uncharacterized protein OCT59_018467 [Rhizophagus irregularis]|uniref:Uncharacterized protein n=1 Tax=Rhizophagus irregularis TaxID=588596 RepID=A0A915ZGS5_9GLOM|nr:hypothetical protein OCT59_018467 [Rhizophagus irregularis]CAB4475382.1 unnamed protein product [Rhizophagus irregularis]CAB5373751.1 unnamed protein product [Rhizophagus irregularis]
MIENFFFFSYPRKSKSSESYSLSEFFRKDGTSELTIRLRKERWIGRKNLENIGLPQYINVPNISRANVTDNNPLREN